VAEPLRAKPFRAESLRVAIVTHYPVAPDRIVGGVQAVSARLVAELSQVADLDLHVIHCHSDVRDSQTVRQGQVTLHFRAQTRRRVIPNMTTGISHITRLLEAIAPDVVHAHGPSFAVAALRAGWNPIWTVHGVLNREVHYFPGLFNRLSFLLAQHYERQALRRVHLMTGVSPYVVEAYRGRSRARWGGHRERSRPIVLQSAPPACAWPSAHACFIDCPERSSDTDPGCC